MSEPLFESSLSGLELLNRGKVRDIYAVGDDHLLIVATDRLSAFDVVLPTAIPGKGEILTQLSRFWFDLTKDLVANHMAADLTLADVVPNAVERATLGDRAMVVRRLKPLPIEAIVRGYIIGSGWKDYQRTGAVCGIGLPAGLRLADQLPEPLFTPSTKADVGEHDENIDYAQTVSLIGAERAAEVRDTALAIYTRARDHASARGIIIADTKFEFGLDDDGQLVLIDEVLTPDSSRFWPADSWRPGENPPSFDKQFVRDWLETQPWNKKAPGPILPPEIATRTAEKYREALQRLTA
ncbi:MAG: phosphoribosylaminoimidazolesuccinocarboxamide synthase [Chromatiales bacterium]|nr:phosphoribosylaminoimidazolesuccinocarboxamide synthase [Chromatiales bacterium]